MPTSLYPIFATKILVILIGILFYKKLQYPYRLFLLHVIIALATELYDAYLNYIEQPSNTWLFNIYFIVELWIVAWAGVMFLQRRNVRKHIVLALGGFTIYWGINFWFKHSEGMLLNIFSITSSLFLVALYVWILFTSISFSNQKVFTNPLFYICVSCLLYLLV